MPKLPSVNHLRAVKALEKAGFHKASYFVENHPVVTIDSFLNNAECV
jgi:hypothetical protein